MIVINVVTFNGQAPVERLFAEFDELGGSIGRGEGNTLVLPDPERRISRTHASIAFQGGRYVIQDRGTAMPVSVNGVPIGQGNESPIVDGDELIIGTYTLRVTVKSSADSYATQFGAPSPAAASGPTKDDPLALFGAGASAVKDPFADLAPPPSAAKSPNTPSQTLMDDPFALPPSKGGQGAGIPADFDPFADLGRAPAASSGAAKLPDDFDLGLGPSTTNQSIDELFGLGPATSVDPLGTGGPLGDPLSSSGGAQIVDPLIALSGVSPPIDRIQQTQPQRNDTPELYGHFQAPAAKPDPAMAKPLPIPNPPPPATPELNSMVLSWDDHHTSSGEIKTMIINPRRREQLEEVAPLPTPAKQSDAAPKTPAAPQSASADPLALFGAASPAADPLGLKQATTPAVTPPNSALETAAKAPKPPQPVSPAVAPAARSNATSAIQDELLRAFLMGAGVPNLQIPGGLTTETMHMLGTVLRESMQGTLDLLLARAMIKREVRAEVTMIVARENNPLKFSPNVDAALTHLLAPQTRGFMPPIKAMKDAYNDLRSHQFGFMAGMRAALAGVLQRFNPEQLEQRISQKRVIDTLLPMNRKAKLWDMFEDLYGDISKEAEDDFHALFGKEFVRAYEAQIEKLEREDNRQE
jgi:FHA domain-containing protein